MMVRLRLWWFMVAGGTVYGGGGLNALFRGWLLHGRTIELVVFSKYMQVAVAASPSAETTANSLPWTTMNS